MQVSVFNKRLSYDLQHVKRMNSFQADNDALSCYDRVIDGIAVLASVRMGLTIRVARYMKWVLTGFKHRILLGGRSSKAFFSLSSKNIHGMG